jgi:thioredoxin-related protein
MKKILLLLFLTISLLFSQELDKPTELVANGKGVIFVFESKTCPYCDLLKKDFKENKQMQELAKNFNIYYLDIEEDNDYIVGEKKKKESTMTLKMAFAAKATPNIVIFDQSWNRIFQLPGYAHPEQMITFMKFVEGLHNKTYKVNEWQKFLNDNGVS